MKTYIFFLKILLLMSMLLVPLKPLGYGFPKLYWSIAVALPIFILLVVAYCVVKKRIIIGYQKHISLYFIAILVWMVIGANNGYDFIQEGTTLSFMMLSLIAIIIAYKERLIGVAYVKKIAYGLMYCWCGVYMIIALGMIFNIIPENIIMQLFSIWLEAHPNAELNSGFLGLMPRMGAGENILPLIIYAYYLVDKNAGSIAVWLMMFMYVMIDYGRIDMAFFLILTIVFLYLKLKRKKLKIKDILMIGASLIMCVLLMNIFFTLNNIDVDIFLDGWTERYGRESTERYMQIKYLTEYIECSMWFGYGLGSYTPEYTRDGWVYEMQLYAFIMQMGIIGFAAIIVNYLIYFIRTVFCDINKKYIMITLLCFLFWLMDAAFQGGVYYGVGRIICIVIYMFTRKEIASVNLGDKNV